MGSGAFDPAEYDARVRDRVTTGTTTFSYSSSVDSGDVRSLHPDLDPMNLVVRESRDSADHPNSRPVAIFLDTTGSMGSIPGIVQGWLKQLMTLLIRKGYLADPQILTGAFKDATNRDRFPFQMGQFESDIRIDEQLTNLYIGGSGGGGGKEESYELVFYAMGFYTMHDAWEKRGEKGYLFIVGDENAYPRISSRQVREIFGHDLQGDISFKDAVAKTLERYHVFYILPRGANHGGKSYILDFWRDILGSQNVLELDKPDGITELIGVTIGTNEGTAVLDEAIEHLRDLGTSDAIIKDVTNALSLRTNKNEEDLVTSGGHLPGLVTGESLDSRRVRRL